MDLQGSVLEIDEKNVVIDVIIIDFGINDGVAYVDIDNITRIDCDTDVEQQLKLMRESS
jgi:hypothetical protein